VTDPEVTRVEVEFVLWRTGARADEPVSVDEIAAEAGLPSEIVAELLALGLARPMEVAGAERRWPRSAAVDAARAVRLARDLGLNAQGAVLALELLERIEELKRRIAREGGGPPGRPRS
jgi:chaperone modulatory protein CbpM